MKTSVEKMFFDWQDPNTGESPKSYQIRVIAPGSECDGDLMTHRLTKLLKDYSDKVVSFPKSLLTEVYDDCCYGLAGYLLTSSALRCLKETPCDLSLRNYSHISKEEWRKLVEVIFSCMRLRVLADANKYFEMFTAPTKDNLGSTIISDERIVKANEDYAVSGDFVLSLEDRSLMPELTLILLGLRRDIWRTFWQNADVFEPFDEEETA